MRVLVSISFLIAAAASGQRTGPRPTADPLELARKAQSLGDEEVLRRIAQGAGAERLGAIRAAPWLREPRAAVAALAAVAGGDDPQLAPAAALALWRIARAMAGGADELGEPEDETLREALEATSVAASDESVRADLRALLADAEACLREAWALPRQATP